MKLKRRIAEGFRPFLWLLADAAVVGAIAWPAAALLLFLVNPELPFTPAGFFATMVAILPQALLVFVLAGPLLVLIGTAIAVLSTDGRAGIANPDAHGFSEILSAFTSAANNNGSAFAGLSANTPFYNVMLGIAVLIFDRREV